MWSITGHLVDSIHESNEEKGSKKEPPLTAKDFAETPIGQPTDPRCVCHFGVVCELHPDKSWEHDDCGGAGDPCPQPDCPYKDEPDAIFAAIHCQVQPRKRRPVRKTELPN